MVYLEYKIEIENFISRTHVLGYKYQSTWLVANDQTDLAIYIDNGHLVRQTLRNYIIPAHKKHTKCNLTLFIQKLDTLGRF